MNRVRSIVSARWAILAVVWATAALASSPLDEELIRAVDGGDAAAVQTLLKRGADVNARNADRDTALMRATRQGNLEVLQALLGKGADVNARDVNGSPALAAAFRYGKPELAVVQALLAKGADANAHGKTDPPPLIAASRAGYIEVLQTLLASGADINAHDDISAYDTAASTALILASTEGNFAVVQALLAKGADVNARDVHGSTALIAASREGHLEVAQALLAKGADVTAQDEHGATALDEVANADIRELLVIPAHANLRSLQFTDSKSLFAAAKVWPAVADRTLVVYANKTDDPSPSVDADAIDLTVIVFKTSTGEQLQRLRSLIADDENGGGSDKMWTTLRGIVIDTANYALGPGNRAFGVRLQYDPSASCSERHYEDLHLFEVRDKALRQIAKIPSYSKESIHACGDPCGQVDTETKTVVRVTSNASRAHADLLLNTSTVESRTAEKARNESAAKPAEADRTDDEIECEDEGSKRSVRTITLRFDQKTDQYQ